MIKGTDSSTTQHQEVTNPIRTSGDISTAEAPVSRQSTGVAPTQHRGSSLERSGAETQQKLQLSTPLLGDVPGRRPITEDMKQVFSGLNYRLEADLGKARFRAQDRSLGKNARSSAKTEVKKLDKALQTLTQQIKPIVDKSGPAPGTLSVTDTAKMSLGFEKITAQLPRGGLSNLTKLLGQHLKSDWMQMENEKQKSSLLKEVAPLFEPGAGKVRVVSASVNGGGGLLEVPGTGATVGPYADLTLSASHSKFVGPDDEGLCFEDKGKSVGGGVSAGVKAKAVEGMELNAGAGIKGQYTRNDFVEFNDAKDYVNKQGHKQVYADRTGHADQSKSGRFSRFFRSKLPNQPGSELKHLKSEQQKAANSQHRLNSLLASELGINAKVSAPPPERSKPLQGHYHTFAWQGNIGAKASNIAAAHTGVNAGGSVGVSHKGAVTNLYEFVPSPISEVITSNAARLNELPSNLTRHAKQVMNGSNDPQKATDTLKSLGNDVGKYYETVQRYDDLKSDKSSRGSKKERKNNIAELRAQKHSLENKWGAIGRHQFLQVASASHAHLANIAMPAGAEHSQDTTDTVKQTAARVQFPEIKHSKQRLDKIASFQQLVYLKITDNKTSLDISVGPFSGRLDILQRDRVHPSRVREGSYRDISLTGTVSGSVQGLTNKAVFTAKLKEAAAKQGVELPGDLNIAPDVGGSASVSKMVRYFKPKYTQEPGYEGDKGFRRQFVRDTTTKSVSAGVGLSGTVAPGAHAGGKISISQDTTHVKGETLGTDDLSYTMTRFNRMYRNAGKTPDNEEWKRFQQDHKTEYGKIFEHLGDSKRGVYKEAQHFLNELINLKDLSPEKKEEAKSFKQEFNQAMSDYRADPGDGARYEKANQFLNRFLEKQTEPWWEAHTGTWKDLKFDQGPDSGLDRRTRLIKNMGIHSRANQQSRVFAQQTRENESQAPAARSTGPRTLANEPSALRQPVHRNGHRSSESRVSGNEASASSQSVQSPERTSSENRVSGQSQGGRSDHQDQPTELSRQSSVSSVGSQAPEVQTAPVPGNTQTVEVEVHRDPVPDDETVITSDKATERPAPEPRVAQPVANTNSAPPEPQEKLTQTTDVTWV
ncbi:hypothetical protein [Motiliproteus sp. MSK22-1]|uniref:hypothetical protein n=1 Tax=Motiliproteus sp. MSK22-1 TaxID=1897630 RepID=UPI000977E3E9|nr:hypothetical protein [Motiliproteus sp. MSK22-1]OMH25616.1 hypothetical protein BGP75_24010 [Motiliproteus sp. MSK22-1]